MERNNANHRTQAKEIGEKFRIYLDLFKKELRTINPSPMAWTMFAISASKKFYNARYNREDV